MGVSLGVTTSLKATADVHAVARARAAAWGFPFVDRRERSMAELHESADAFLIFANTGLTIATLHGRLRPSLSTAEIRLRSIARGDGDPLQRAGELEPGDVVVDCTYGLGRDGAIAATIIGIEGSITGIEASDALFHMAAENPPLASLQVTTPLHPPAIVELVHADAREWLAKARPSSADVVLIDPMFKTPKTSDATFALLRSVASDVPLDAAWVEAAKRVARRWVVVKSGTRPAWFSDVGLQPVHSHGNARWYRVAPGN